MSCHFKVIADGHTDTQTHRHTDRQTDILNTIVPQPLCGSTNNTLKHNYCALKYVRNSTSFVMSNTRRDNNVGYTVVSDV